MVAMVFLIQKTIPSKTGIPQTRTRMASLNHLLSCVGILPEVRIGLWLILKNLTRMRLGARNAKDTLFIL